MRQNRFLFCILFFLVTVCLSCGGKKEKQNMQGGVVTLIQSPVFDADSAYRYVQAQVDFGPRVPNTDAHKACGDYLVAQLKAFGADVIEQPVTLTTYDGTSLNARNIIGQYNPESRKRVLLCAHWDSRPWADNDLDEKNWRKPVTGANDGASGVGVLLEVARQLWLKAPEIGIDIIFFDAEDWGVAEFDESNAKDSWCLGSQYWARNPHKQKYNARYGILLDMVGAPASTFYVDQTSKRYALSVADKVWNTAHGLGYGMYFPKNDVGLSVMDDHYYVNRFAGIPCIDIINCDVNNERSSFGSRWHTVNDNMEGIDKATLKAVGQTLLQVIYNER